MCSSATNVKEKKYTIRSQYGAEKYSTHHVILITNCASNCGVFSRFSHLYRPFKPFLTFYKFAVTFAKQKLY